MEVNKTYKHIKGRDLGLIPIDIIRLKDSIKIKALNINLSSRRLGEKNDYVGICEYNIKNEDLKNWGEYEAEGTCCHGGCDSSGV